MDSRVLIAGAGPAGSVCAWRLAAGGCSCVLLDGCVFPRNKVCGGALGSRTSELLTNSGMLSQDEFDRLVVAWHDSMACYSEFDLLRSYTSPSQLIAIVDRITFDNFLLERAASAGAAVITGDRIEDVLEGSVVTRSGRRLDWDALVGADGAVSTVRRKVFGRSRRRQGLGLQVIVPGRVATDEKKPVLQIHFGLIPYGYGWVFPRRNDCCIGMGSMAGRVPAADLAESFREFLMRFVGGDQPLLQGAVIPSLSLHPAMGRGNVYLAGDAAGLTDQISGEGICHAVESGLLVAEAILSGDRKRMERRASKGCVGNVRLSARYRHLLYSRACSGRAMRGLREREKFFREYWNLVSGTAGYSGMMKRFLRDRSGDSTV